MDVRQITINNPATGISMNMTHESDQDYTINNTGYEIEEGRVDGQGNLLAVSKVIPKMITLPACVNNVTQNTYERLSQIIRSNTPSEVVVYFDDGTAYLYSGSYFTGTTELNKKDNIFGTKVEGNANSRQL